MFAYRLLSVSLITSNLKLTTNSNEKNVHRALREDYSVYKTLYLSVYLSLLIVLTFDFLIVNKWNRSRIRSD